MSARRLLTATVAFAWLLPTLVAGGVALHVAFEHSVDHEHQTTSGPVAAPTLTESDHVHPASESPHEHSTVVAAGGVALRRALDSAAHAAAVGATEIPVHRIGADTPSPVAERLAGPPRASGPPLLARLSAFRI